jgi:hypothetical protein
VSASDVGVRTNVRARTRVHSGARLLCSALLSRGRRWSRERGCCAARFFSGIAVLLILGSPVLVGGYLRLSTTYQTRNFGRRNEPIAAGC